MSRLPKLQTKMIFETTQSVETKIQNLWSHYRTLKHSPLDSRLKNLYLLKDALNSELPLLSDLISDQMGKTRADAQIEMKRCFDHIDYYAQIIRKLKPARQNALFSKNKQVSLWKPSGVIYKITPFNGPVWQGLKIVIPNLAVGNSTLVRGPETCHVLCDEIQRIVKDAGVLGLEYVSNSLEDTEYIISHKFVKGKNFLIYSVKIWLIVVIFMIISA